jgi:hypothetical protein
MQKVEGSSPFSRLYESPLPAGFNHEQGCRYLQDKSYG